MPLRIVPDAGYPAQTSNTKAPGLATGLAKGAPSAPGVPDTFRANLTAPIAGCGSQQAQVPVSTHPLEARLLQWRQTQDSLKMENLRRLYGIAEPVRRGMEMKIVKDGTFKPAILGGGKGTSIHEDILALGGRETEVTWEDVYPGDELKEPATFHDEMEQRLKMNW